MSAYTKKDLDDMFFENRPYQKECVNYQGQLADGTKYNEYLASLVKSSKFNIVKYEKTRERFLFDHQSFDIDPRSEKGLCRRFCRDKSFIDSSIIFALGVPIEYEINIVENTKVNIDLASFFEEENCLYIIEVKGKKEKDNSYYSTEETLLRCILEIETYYQSIVEKKEVLLKDLLKDKYNKDIELKKAILIPSDSFASNQVGNPEFQSVNRLLEDFDIKVIIYDKNIKIE